MTELNKEYFEAQIDVLKKNKALKIEQDDDSIFFRFPHQSFAIQKSNPRLLSLYGDSMVNDNMEANALKVITRLNPLNECVLPNHFSSEANQHLDAFIKHVSDNHLAHFNNSNVYPMGLTQAIATQFGPDADYRYDIRQMKGSYDSMSILATVNDQHSFELEFDSESKTIKGEAFLLDAYQKAAQDNFGEISKKDGGAYIVYSPDSIKLSFNAIDKAEVYVVGQFAEVEPGYPEEQRVDSYRDLLNVKLSVELLDTMIKEAINDRKLTGAFCKEMAENVNALNKVCKDEHLKNQLSHMLEFVNQVPLYKTIHNGQEIYQQIAHRHAFSDNDFQSNSIKSSHSYTPHDIENKLGSKVNLNADALVVTGGLLEQPLSNTFDTAKTLIPAQFKGGFTVVGGSSHTESSDYRLDANLRHGAVPRQYTLNCLQQLCTNPSLGPERASKLMDSMMNVANTFAPDFAKKLNGWKSTIQENIDERHKHYPMDKLAIAYQPVSKEPLDKPKKQTSMSM